MRTNFMEVLTRIFGRDPESQEKIDFSRNEAHLIKNNIQKDLIKVTKKVEKTKLKHIKDLENIQNEVERVNRNVAEHIAIATGGKRRGYNRN